MVSLKAIKKEKRFRIVTEAMGIGGAERQLSLVLPELAKKGWTIDLFLLRKDLKLATSLLKAGVKIHAPPQALNTKILAPLSFLWAFISLIGSFLKDRQTPTLFLLPRPYLVGMTAALITRLKAATFMFRLGMNYYQKKYPLLTKYELYLHKKVTKIVGNSLGVNKPLMEEEGVPLTRLKILYNGIPIKDFECPQSREGVRKALDLQRESLVFIIVANLFPYKGHLDLLKALSLVKNKLPRPFDVLIVGRDEENHLETLKETRDGLGLKDNVQFLGSRSDIPDLLHASDVGLLCSHEEGFSNSILEGMAAGLPMVVTDVGGNKEAVLDGETGFVVLPKDPQSLSKALLKISTNASRRKEFGMAGQKHLLENFTLEKCVKAHEQLIEPYL